MNNYYNTNPYMYPQNTYPSVPVPQNQSNIRQGIIWVNGEEGARSYVMTPNSNVMLLDAENEGRFYIKSSDNIGMSSLRIFDYKEIVDAQPVSNNSPQYSTSPIEYATKQELQELKDMINSLGLTRGGNRGEQSIQPAQLRAKNTQPNSNQRD